MTGHRAAWLGLLLFTAFASNTTFSAIPPGYPRSYENVIASAYRQARLDIYSTTDAREIAPLLRDFRGLHPQIDIRYSELASTELYERFVAEVAAKKASADLLWSGAMDLQIKLVNDGYAQPHTSWEKPNLPPWAVWKNEAYGVTAEPVVMAYNKRLMAPAEAPRTHAQLEQLLKTQPNYSARVAAYDPERSGIGFLHFTQDVEVTRDTWRLIRALGAARVKLFTSTDAMLECVSSGECLIAYNVMGSYAIGRATRDSSVAVVLPEDYVLTTSRIALISAEARHPDAAKLFIDYLLSMRGQRLLAAMHTTPVRNDVSLHTARASTQRERAIRVGPELLANLDRLKRLRFLQNWRRALEEYR